MMPRSFLFTVLIWLLVAGTGPTLYACPICFQIEDGAGTASVRAAVFVLVGVTASVLGCCGVFVARFARRASRLGIERESRERLGE